MRRQFLLLVLLFSSMNLQAQTLTISTIEGSPVSFVSSYILREIYKKAGLDLEIISMPATRATIQSTTGATDGETHRVKSYGNIHPELLIVQPSYYCIDTVLFAQKGSDALQADLEEISRYRVAILKGVKNAIELTEGFADIQEFETSLQMMQFLALGRTDYVLLSHLNGNSVLKDNKIENITVYDPPIERTCLYHYLHISHSDLIPKLERTIKELKESGELEEITRRAEASLNNP